MSLLRLTGLLDDHIGVARFAIHQVVVTDEASTIFKDQCHPSKLIRCSRFAATIELRVGFEEAEQFLAVGYRFLQQDASKGRVTDLHREFNPPLQLLGQRIHVSSSCASFSLFLQGFRTFKDRCDALEQSCVGL